MVSGLGVGTEKRRGTGRLRAAGWLEGPGEGPSDEVVVVRCRLGFSVGLRHLLDIEWSLGGGPAIWGRAGWGCVRVSCVCTWCSEPVYPDRTKGFRSASREVSASKAGMRTGRGDHWVVRA